MAYFLKVDPIFNPPSDHDKDDDESSSSGPEEEKPVAKGRKPREVLYLDEDGPSSKPREVIHLDEDEDELINNHAPNVVPPRPSINKKSQKEDAIDVDLLPDVKKKKDVVVKKSHKDEAIDVDAFRDIKMEDEDVRIPARTIPARPAPPRPTAPRTTALSQASATIKNRADDAMSVDSPPATNTGGGLKRKASRTEDLAEPDDHPVEPTSTRRRLEWKVKDVAKITCNGEELLVTFDKQGVMKLADPPGTVIVDDGGHPAPPPPFDAKALVHAASAGAYIVRASTAVEGPPAGEKRTRKQAMTKTQSASMDVDKKQQPNRARLKTSTTNLADGEGEGPSSRPAKKSRTKDAQDS